MFRIIGAEGVNFKKMTPEDIAGNFDYEPLGQSMSPNPDVLRQQLIEYLAMIKGDPIYLEKTDLDEVMVEFWKSLDHQFPERFILKGPAKQWDPGIENAAMMQGAFVDVDVNENHPEHIQKHQPILAEAADKPEVIQVVMEHIQKHTKYAEAMQSQSPQEMPGRAAQYAGEMPPSTPGGVTQGSLESVVGGGTSG